MSHRTNPALTARQLATLSRIDHQAREYEDYAAGRTEVKEATDDVVRELCAAGMLIESADGKLLYVTPRGVKYLLEAEKI